MTHFDYERYLSHLEERARQPAAAVEEFQTPEVRPERWPGLDPERRALAETAEARLTSVVEAGYARFVAPLEGSARRRGWRGFSTWRRRLEQRYSTAVFGSPPNHWRITAPEAFQEDINERETALAEHHAAAEERYETARRAGLLPLRAPVRMEDAGAWLDLESPIEEPWAAQYREALRSCGWTSVFHITRVEHLPSVALLGLLPGAIASYYSPDAVERESRAQSNDDKEFLTSLALCTAFFPPWWVFDRLDGRASSVIVAVSAEAVCTRPGTAFFSRPTRDSTYSSQDLLANRNDTERGWTEFEKCWEDGRPLSGGWGPRAIGPEIYSDRIHPRHIRALLFENDDPHAQWFEQFNAIARENYGDVAPVGAVGSVRLNGRWIRFGD